MSHWTAHLRQLIQEAREREMERWTEEWKASIRAESVRHVVPVLIRPVDVSTVPPCSSVDDAFAKHGDGSKVKPTSTNE